MHNTDLHEDVNIQMDLLQEGGGTQQLSQSPQISADFGVTNVDSHLNVDREEEEQLRYDHALLFAPVRRFADLLQPTDEENTYASLSNRTELPQYIQEIDKHSHRRHHYPHVHHPLHQMEPRALRKVRRRMRRVREEDRLRNPPSVVPLELQVTSADEISENINVVGGSGRRRRRSSKKQEPFRPVLSHLEEDGGEDVCDLRNSSPERVEEKSSEAVVMPHVISFLEEIHSEMPPICLQPLSSSLESGVTRGVLEDVNSPSSDHRQLSQQAAIASRILSFHVAGHASDNCLHDFQDDFHDSNSLSAKSYVSPRAHHHAQKEYFSAELLRKRTCSGADIADDAMELHKSVTEPEEAATLQQADLDEMRSHRFADFRGLRHPHMRKTSKQCDHRSGGVGRVDVQEQAAVQQQLDHTPHELFVELDELVTPTSSSGSCTGECVWVERSRWIRFEENLEPTSARWTQPHVAPLQFHALAEFRRLLEQGCCLFDLDAKDLVHIVECVCQELLRTDVLNAMEVARLRQDLLRRHDAGTTATTMAGFSAKPSLLHKFQHAASSFLQQQHHTIASRVSNDAQTASVLVGGVGYLQRPLLVFVRLAQAVHLLDMPLTEVPSLPLRFLLICMGPNAASDDCHEVGRSLATLMTDAQFHRHAYAADCREDLTRGLRDFLERTTVLPPFHEGSTSAWHSAQMIRHLARFQRSRCTSRQSRTSRQHAAGSGVCESHMGLGSGGGELSDATDNVPGASRGSTLCLKASDRRSSSATECTSRFPWFSELLQDFRIQRIRFANDMWHWSNMDKAVSTVIFGVVLMFLSSLVPCLTLGALLQNLVSSTVFTVERCLVATCFGQVLLSLLGGQPLLIIGVTGPLLIMEQAASVLLLHMTLEVSLTSFRFLVAIYTAVVSLFIIGLNAAHVIRRMTRDTEEFFNLLVGFFFILQACSKIFGPLLLPVGLLSHFSPTFNSSATSNNSLPTTNVCSSNRSAIASPTALCLDTKTLRHRDPTQEDVICVVYSEHCGLAQVRAKAAATILLSLLLLFLVVGFNRIRRSNFFTTKIRAFFGAGHVLVALLLVTLVNGVALKDFCLATLSVSQRAQLADIFLFDHMLNPLGNLRGVGLHGLALLMGIGVALIIFTETGLCCATLAKSEKGVFSRRSGYHTSLLVTGVVLPPICGYFGWPFLTASVLRSTAHTFTMGLWDVRQPPGVPPQLRGVAEQRLSGLSVAMLMLCTLFAVPVLSSVPMAAVYSVFLCMGFATLNQLQIMSRCVALLQCQCQRVAGADYLQVPTTATFVFTCIKLVFIGLLIALNLATQLTGGQPYSSLVFAVLILIPTLILLARPLLFPHLPSCARRYLDVVDRSSTASLEVADTDGMVCRFQRCSEGSQTVTALQHLLHEHTMELDAADHVDSSYNSVDLFDELNKPL